VAKLINPQKKLDNYPIMKYISNILIISLEALMKEPANIAYIAKGCVACGCCVAVCPRTALRIDRGVRAVVDSEKCVGCGKCAGICPAAVISITKRGGAQ
jgi:2-oxoglutarate ferredoxin oxidoreductase subunit delta